MLFTIKGKTMKPLILFLIQVLLLKTVIADDKIAEPVNKIQIGIIETLNSKFLEEERILNVYLPPSYSESSQKPYPVIYLLDGAINEDFLHVAGLIQFLTMYKLMPETILVGIANIDRKRDFTYPTNIQKLKRAVPTSGGSAKFIKFITSEVIPFIASRYTIDDNHMTIVGQSLGGLLASEILLKHPQIFQQYIIVSPSLWWDEQSMINSQLQPKLGPKQKVVLAIGEEGDEMQQVFDKLVNKLNSSRHSKLLWTRIKLPQETHATVLHRSLYQALEFLYRDKYPGL